jgi:hypothetical protein
MVNHPGIKKMICEGRKIISKERQTHHSEVVQEPAKQKCTSVTQEINEKLECGESEQKSWKKQKFSQMNVECRNIRMKIPLRRHMPTSHLLETMKKRKAKCKKQQI